MKIEDIFNNDFFKQFKTGEDLNIEITFFNLHSYRDSVKKESKLKCTKPKIPAKTPLLVF